MAPLAQVGQDDYAEAVLAELEVRAAGLDERRLVSIYIGGGTPSLWAPEHLARVVAAVADRFAAAVAGLEVTLEANPIDCQPDRLEAWRAAGINRLSVGVQSIEPAELALLGRDHSMGDGLAAIDAAAARFRTLSGDVIIGTPAGPSRRPGLDAVAALADRSLPHLSVYELTIEERAPLGRAVERGAVRPLDGDALADLYLAARDLLVGRGYEHYEVSSFARPGHRARHNSLYWTGGEYLGLGSSAASMVADGAGALRWTNHRSVGRYLGAPADQRIAERRRLGADDHARDRVWLGMRTDAGFEAEHLDRIPDGRQLERWLIEAGLGERDGDRIRPTLRGFLMADRVAQRVLARS